MSYLPVIILIVFLAGLAFIAFRAILAPMRGGMEKQLKIAESKKREKRAVWAGATVITVNKPKMDRYGMRQLKVDLLLVVESPVGEKYQAKTSWLVDEDMMPQIQPGASLSVRIDAEDPEIIYPNMRGVDYWVEG
jgi:hypothetical protein